LISDFPSAKATLDLIDEVCEESRFEPVSNLLLDPAAPTLDQLVAERSSKLDMALFAGSMAIYEIMSAADMHPDVVVGHSFGELAALSSAGVLSVVDSARLACERLKVFRQSRVPEGGMIAVPLDGRRAAHLAGFIDDPHLVVAVENGPEQCVISGTSSALADLERITEAARISSTRLRAAYPFHNPVMRECATMMSEAAAKVRMSPPRIPVYSPILSGYLESESDLRRLIETHLTKPVLFYDAVLRLYRDGVRTFLEVGSRETLSSVIRNSLPAGVTAITPLRRNSSREDLADTLSTVGHETHAVVGFSKTSVKNAATVVEPAAEAAQEPILPVRVTPEKNADPSPIGENLLTELRVIYAQLLDLPEELLTEDIDLEADLGVDSLKQVELFEHLRKKYKLGELPQEMRVTSYTTLSQIAELINKLAARVGAHE